MSSDHEAEIRASVGAHYELGSRYDEAVAEGLVERIGAEIDKRIDARLGQSGSPTGAQVTPGVPGSPVGPEVPPGQAMPYWPAPAPGVPLPHGISLPPGVSLPPGASGPAAPAPPGYYQPPPGYPPPSGYQPPPGYQPAGYQVPPGYQPAGYQVSPGYQLPPGYQVPPGYQGYPGYYGYPGHQGYQGPVPPGYPVPAPGAQPPSTSNAHRSVAFTITALGSMAFGVLGTAIVSARMPGPGAQAIMVLLIWTAIVIINIAHARRR